MKSKEFLKVNILHLLLPRLQFNSQASITIALRNYFPMREWPLRKTSISSQVLPTAFIFMLKSDYESNSRTDNSFS